MGVADLADYPWDAVAPYAARARAHPDGIVDLSIGSPVDPTPARRAPTRSRAATDAHAYPQTVGTPALREAIADWYARRRGVPGLTPAARAPHDRLEGARRAAAAAARSRPRRRRRAPARGLPDVRGRRAAGRRHPVRGRRPGGVAGRDAAGLAQLARQPRRPRAGCRGPARRGRAARASSAPCSRPTSATPSSGWDAPWDARADPVGARPARDRAATSRGVLSVYSLSKQSNLAGYRAAFLAGDPAIVARLLTARKHLGLMLPAPVQAAMIAALGDDEHVAAQKERYRARREHAQARARGRRLPHRPQRGGPVPLGDARAATRGTSLGRLADLGILAGPGHFYGEHFPQHVRLSLTATDERIAAAAARLSAR